MAKHTDELGTVYYNNEEGKRHRVDGPAVISREGDQYWYINGLCHRTDGPAMDLANGTKIWHFNNQIHRTDGPAMTGVKSRLTNQIESKWYIEGRELSGNNIRAAKDIINGKLTEKIPLLINHPVLKYFCHYVLEHGPKRPPV